MRKELFDTYAEAIAEVLNLSDVGDIFMRTKDREITEARQYLCYLSFKEGIPLVLIQKLFAQSGLSLTHGAMCYYRDNVKKNMRKKKSATKRIINKIKSKYELRRKSKVAN